MLNHFRELDLGGNGGSHGAEFVNWGLMVTTQKPSPLRKEGYAKVLKNDILKSENYQIGNILA